MPNPGTAGFQLLRLDGFSDVAGELFRGAMPTVLSCVFAAGTASAMTRPSTWTARPRLRPGTRFAPSRPVGEAGTPAATWALLRPG